MKVNSLWAVEVTYRDGKQATLGFFYTRKQAREEKRSYQAEVKATGNKIGARKVNILRYDRGEVVR